MIKYVIDNLVTDLKKIVWVDRSAKKHVLVAQGALTDADLEPVQQWCRESRCGTRTSFDTFVFRTAAEKTMFLLRWL